MPGIVAAGESVVINQHECSPHGASVGKWAEKLRTPGGLVNPTPTPSEAGNLHFQQLPEEALTLHNTLGGGASHSPRFTAWETEDPGEVPWPPSYAKRANGSGSLTGPFAGVA